MEYKGLVRRQKEFFETGKTKKPGFRVFYLGRLLKWMEENEARILDALNKDLGKSSTEGYMTEIGMVKEEIRFAMKHLTLWSKPRRALWPRTDYGSVELSFPAYGGTFNRCSQRRKLCRVKTIVLLGAYV